jgi:TolA-binding protein
LDLYQDLVSHPTASVSKPMAQLELASLYEATKQNAEAARLYQEIVKENPGATAASFARQHMQGQK